MLRGSCIRSYSLTDDFFKVVVSASPVVYFGYEYLMARWGRMRKRRKGRKRKKMS